jgi:hypothetical protein
MHKLYELKDKLMDELESYVENGKITPTAAEEIKVLSASIDHICNICKDAEEEDGYSGRMYPDGMGGSYRGYAREGRGYSSEGGYSNARGRMNVQRDSRGRYSGADGDVEDIKRDMQRLMDKVEKM